MSRLQLCPQWIGRTSSIFHPHWAMGSSGKPGLHPRIPRAWHGIGLEFLTVSDEGRTGSLSEGLPRSAWPLGGQVRIPGEASSGDRSTNPLHRKLVPSLGYLCAMFSCDEIYFDIMKLILQMQL